MTPISGDGPLAGQEVFEPVFQSPWLSVRKR